MPRFGKFSSNSSSSSASEEEEEKEAESAIEKGLRLIVPMGSNKMNDLNQKAILGSSKHRFPFNNNRKSGITVCCYIVT